MLATCDEHGLNYVIDKTNFQPEVTLRNAVRHALAVGGLSDVSVFLTIPFPTLTKARISVVTKRYRE